MTSPAVPTRPYVVVANDVGLARHHGSKMVTARLVNELSSRGFAVVTIPAGQDWHDHTKFIDRAAAVLVNGEGTLHHSAPAAQNLLALAPYCQARSLPVFLVNSLWQDNSPTMAQQARNFTEVFVRESKSQKQLADAGVPSLVVPDLVLGWILPDAPGETRTGVVMTDSVVMSDTHILAAAAKATGAVFTTLEPPDSEPLDYTHCSFIRLHAEAPTSMSEGWRRVVQSAYRARGALYATVRRWRGHQVEFSLEDFYTLLHHTELLITGRFHAVCMAMITGTPFLAPRSNSHKIEAMLDDAGMSHRLIDSKHVRESVVVPPPWTDLDAESVARYAGDAARAQHNMFETIARYAQTERPPGS